MGMAERSRSQESRRRLDAFSTRREHGADHPISAEKFLWNAAVSPKICFIAYKFYSKKFQAHLPLRLPLWEPSWPP